MKFTNKKRGFTIVELIIVIAVIAVLAAVLIPVFSGLIQQGKDAEAKVVVNTLNKGLAMTTTKPATMQSALEAVETNVGINVAKLDETYAKTGNKILWDSEYNTFLFVTKDGEKVSAPNVDKFTDKEINLWAVAKTSDDLKDNYSHYWYGGDVAAVEVATGFDAGEASINAITYKTDAAQSVVIRTNSEKTELTINAKNSDVKHYDVAGNVKVLAVKGASYHEYGNVIGTVTVESGHVQIESGAEVASVIASKSASETVAASVTATSGATVGTVVVNNDTASVEVKSGATVAEVAPGKGVTIDTSKVTGITPSTTVIDTEKASDFAGGLGTETSPYLIATAEQYLNIKQFEVEMQTKPYYFALVADIDLSKVTVGTCVANTFNGKLDGRNHNVLVNESQYYMFKYAVDNVSIENLSWTLNGSRAIVFFLRYGTTASSYSDETKLYTTVGNTINLSFKNIAIHGQKEIYHAFEIHNAGLLTYCQSYVEILNAKAIGGKPDANKDSYYAYTSETTNCHTNTVIDGAVISANLSAASSAYNAVLLGGQTMDNNVTVSDVTYSGTFIGKQVGLVFANANACMDDLNKFSFNNVKLAGAFIYTQESDASAGITFANNSHELDGAVNNGIISQLTSDSTLKLSVENSQYNLVAATNANVNKYVLTLKLSALKFTDETYTADFGEASTNYITLTVEPGQQEIYKAKNLTRRQAESNGITLTENWKTSNEGTKYQFVNSNDQWYIVIDYAANGYYREFKNTDAICSAKVYAYDQSGKLLHMVDEK